jgi:2,3-bisphosphoglycerate-independent phosphoglycerate mutase
MANPHLAPRRPVVLMILDGFGVNPSRVNNAVLQANTPNLDRYFSHNSHTTLSASGHAVGLPDGQMGNSEVGHLTLGCGSIVRQDLVKINDAIESGEFFNNRNLNRAIDIAASSDKPVHLMGLVSDGGVHSHMEHILALIKLCKARGAKPLLHMITDGRDTPPKSAIHFLDEVEPMLNDAGGAVTTIMGRYYAMDRDKRWERTELAWRAYILGKGRTAGSAHSAIETAYAMGETDEFIKPVVLSAHQPMQTGDQVIFFNFRKDRPKQMVAALALDDFNGFDRGENPKPEITCMMRYDKAFPFPYAFEPEKPAVTLGQVVSEAGLKQFHCAETEKYAHVTYFFNGGRSDPYSGETQMLIPSPKVATYDLKPEMSAYEVADAMVDAINSKQYAFILVNFANGDMVGHTAVAPAVIKAVEALDDVVGKVLDASVANDYSVILTADHGNCEELVDPLSEAPHTQHTSYPVPCLLIDELNWQLSCEGGLANIAPTVLDLMGLEKPHSMTAKSLLLKPCKKDGHEVNSLKGAA